MIIGAGMGGMAAGVFGQINGYDTHVFEAHCHPAGSMSPGREGEVQGPTAGAS
jgi:phytoene dehydrogenase-like protein